MSLLFNVVFAAKASSTHHKIALDALDRLRGPDAPRWRDLFLKHHAAYLAGAKAPDATFKDFKNHVLHVSENYWGGAAESAQQWYQQTVAALRQKNWAEGVYSAGVLSHYYADPIQPFHTGQTEEEGKIHRAAEWSIAKSYEELRAILRDELGGYPTIEPAEGPDWLLQMVRQGAEASHPHYQMLIDHYNFELGVKKPEAGLDREMKTCLAGLLGHAVAGLARILEEAFREASVEPPVVSLALEALLATLSMPVSAIVRKLSDAQERRLLESIAEEVRLTGKAVFTLPEDDWAVRALHAKEVLGVPLEVLNAQPAGPTGTRHGKRAASRPPPAAPAPAREAPLPARERPAARPEPPQPAPPAIAPPRPADPPPPRPAPRAAIPPPKEEPAEVPECPQPTTSGTAEQGPKFRLETSSPIVDAPSIGPKTADRLQAIGIATVADLLGCDPQSTAGRLDSSWITAETVRQWQAEATLACRVPGLRGYEAQILVACGVGDAEELAGASPERLLERVELFATSKAGQRVLRSLSPPDLERVARWIAQAKRARPIAPG